jgi:hypothetical protein
MWEEPLGEAGILIWARQLKEEREFERQMAEIAIETEREIPKALCCATAAGDERRLRGIPCIARGVGGTSPGTRLGAFIDRAVA